MSDEIELAWAAGLFEGEGTVGARLVSLSLTDREVIRRFYRAVACGKIFGPYKRGADHHKPLYQWVVGDKAGIDRFVERIEPQLSRRRRKQLEPLVARFATVRSQRSSCV